MGNFVLVVSEGSFAGEATSFYDVFRVENGKIAEHWHTIEAMHRARNGRTRTVSSDHRIAAPECPVLEELASARH
jgi:predicted SnoaL-like aldol condensation-catalyzing enzyme